MQMSHKLKFAVLSIIIGSLPAESVKLRSWLGSSKFVEGKAPEGRKGGQIMTLLHDKFFLFGGASASGSFNDLHIYHLSSRTWIDVTDYVQGVAPSPRQGHAFKSLSEKLYMFGGRSNLGGFPLAT